MLTWFGLFSHDLIFLFEQTVLVNSAVFKDLLNDKSDKYVAWLADGESDILVVCVDDDVRIFNFASQTKAVFKLHGISAVGKFEKHIKSHFLLLGIGKSIVVKSIKDWSTIATINVDLTSTSSFGKF